MRMLITGAAGMLGRDVREAAEGAGLQVVALSRAELDITDRSAVQAALKAARPEVVINCAAWTDVDAAESEYEAALAVNGAGAGHVAEAAAQAGAWLLHVSTDYVFDGRQQRPYLESDPTAPASGYGRSKLAGEDAVASAAPGQHTIVRTSWLFGAGGHSFPRTILRLADERDQLNVVDDQIGCPTYTGHLGAALVTLADVRLPGLVHVAGDGQCSWFQFARAIVDGAGLSTQVQPCTSAEFPRPAPRPAFSVLRSARGPEVPVLPHWREGLSAFLTKVGVPA